MTWYGVFAFVTTLAAVIYEPLAALGLIVLFGVLWLLDRLLGKRQP